MSNVTAKSRALVFSRDGERCASCGVHSPLSIQHRKNRQMGGSTQRNNLSNLLTLCVGCNSALESDATFRTSGLRMGWKLQSWDDDSQIAVFVQWAHEWRLLDDEGSFTVVDSDDVRRGSNGAPMV